jgi:hypothetical protein
VHRSVNQQDPFNEHQPPSTSIGENRQHSQGIKGTVIDASQKKGEKLFSLDLNLTMLHANRAILSTENGQMKQMCISARLVPSSQDKQPLESRWPVRLLSSKLYAHKVTLLVLLLLLHAPDSHL